MHAHPPASLTWLLVLAILGLFPAPAAFGAALTWQQHPEEEQLVFTFDSRLPSNAPKRHGQTRILVPIPWSFWQKERKPRPPDFSASVFVDNVTVTQEGIVVKIRTPDFAHRSSIIKKEKKLVLEIGPSAKTHREADAIPRHNQTDPLVKNGTAEGSLATDTTSQPVEPTVDSRALSAPDALNATLHIPPPDNTAASLPGTPGLALEPPAEHGAPESPAAAAQAPPAPDAALPSVREPDFISGLGALRGKISPPVQEAGDRLTAPTPKEIQTNAQPGRAGGSTIRQSVSHLGGIPPALELPRGPGQESSEADNPPPSQAQWSINVSNGTPEPAPEQSPAPGPPDTPTPFPLPDNHSSMPAPGNETASDHASTLDNPAPPTAVNATAELEALFKEAQTALSDGNMTRGRQIVTAMLGRPNLPDSLRETLLYTLADITMQQGQGDLEGNFTTILSAYETAKNANLHSRNVPEALASIGYLHLSVGNLPEAKGYFDLLRRKFPDHPRVPLIDYYWGEHALRRGNFIKAVEHFQYVLQNFPGSKAVQPSTLGLLKAFSELGFFDKALEIVGKIEKRWPRYYLADPTFLMTAGHAAMMGGQLDQARDYFWAYINIVPKAGDVDLALARIGDILVRTGKLDAAREIYNRAANAFPDSEGGLIAQMRLAEEGILDQPSVEAMGPVFGRIMSDPEKIYTRILEHPDSPLAPVARLKLAMWRMWKSRFAECLEDIRQFEADYPGHELMPKAREVADKALGDWIERDLANGDFQGVVQNWDSHGRLFEGRDMDPRIRLATAVALMQTGETTQALDMAKPLVFGGLSPGRYAEPALDLLLAVLTDHGRWADILELAEKTGPWKLSPDRQRQIDYAQALALENLEKHAQARPLWTRLGTNMDLNDGQRGYALYFLAKGSMAGGDLEQANIVAQEALNLLKKDNTDIPKIKDCLELLIQAADKSGRHQDALGWSLEYDGYIPETDPEWPAHAYRKAILFKKNSNMAQWRASLHAIRQLFPDSLYSRMASSELEAVRLEQEAEGMR